MATLPNTRACKLGSPAHMSANRRFDMSKVAKPFYFVAIPLIAVGTAFAAVGASGQAAFGYTAVGLLAPGLALLIAGYRKRA